MVVKISEEFFRIYLYHEIGDEKPFEVIEIEDAIDLWLEHKKTN